MIVHIQGPYLLYNKNMKIKTFAFYYLLIIIIHGSKVIRSYFMSKRLKDQGQLRSDDTKMGR